VTRFCVDSSVLGTDEHLLVDDGTFAWTKFVPQSTWHLSGCPKDNSDWCLDTALRLGHASPVIAPPDRFVKAMSVLSGSLGEVPVPWAKVMPGREHQGFTKRLVDDVGLAIVSALLEYYRAIWVPGNAVFRALQPVAVDRSAWRALLEAGAGNLAAVRSFEPDAAGLCQPVGYDRFKTLTGRLTVATGPQILTLKREHRSIIRSVHGDQGSVWALDFAALEARILLYEYGRKCEDPDLYGMIAKELGKDRKAIKGAVISELYGSSKWALGKVLGIEGKELNDFVRNVQAYFRTDELLKRIKAQFVATGKVNNRYGRPVTVDEPMDNIFISYYGQSTGVDVTMLGFKQVIDTLAKKAPKVRPIFLLHDSILLDVHVDDLAEVQKVKHVKVKGYVQKFPLRLEKIS
jgi:hypothetical protein